VRIVEAEPGLAADHFGPVSAAQAQGLANYGVRTMLLYAEVLDAATLTACFLAGLRVGLIIEGLAASTMPTAEIGARLASSASQRCRGLSIPAGPTYWLDAEGDGRPSLSWQAYAVGADGALVAAGDNSGIYVGEGLGLSSVELYVLPQTRYWKSMSRVVDRTDVLAEPACGWCMVQQWPADQTIAGCQVDLSIVGRDYHGRAPLVVSG
jgi:hypothetical protein